MKFTVLTGHRYKAFISVGIFRRSFVTEGVVADKLKDAGFSDVMVRNTSGGTYVALGTWEGPDTEADMPGEIDSVDDLGLQ